jgi:urease accessory protein
VKTLTLSTELDKSRTRAVEGTASLRFARHGSKTILERSFATSPVKFFTTRGRGSACWVYSATLGGGLVGGDAIHMTVDVTRGARALLATQAATKVYRSLRPASQTIVAAVDDEALLAVIPDPIVCFAGADFSQAQRYELSTDANLAAIDWMTSGRYAAGERWAFARYRSRIDIRRDGRRILYDGVTLEPGLDRVADRMGRFEVCLTAVLTGPALAERAAAIVCAASRLGISRDSDVIESASTLADGGTLLRVVGVHVEQVGRLLRERLAFLHPLLGDDLWSRKW